MGVRTLGGLAPSKMKEETPNNLRAIDVGALNTLEAFACINWRKMVINLDLLAPYQGSAWDEWL
jgi:hypothetical protein